MGTQWVWGLVLGGAASVVACAEPVAKQTPLLVCEAGEDGCPSERPVKKRQQKPPAKDDSDDRVIGLPEQAEEEEEPEAEPEEPEPPPLGPICEDLKGCCKQLEEAGYSTATCEEIVSTRSENACSLQHRAYKQYGDCT